MMKQVLVIVLVIGLFLSCEPKLQPKKPENLIPKDKMTEILSDMFVVSSAKGVSRTILEAKGIDPETYILKKYNIDSLQFAQSNDYYAHDIETYKEIIEEIKAKLTSEKQKYEAENKKEEAENKKKKDSLIKLKQVQRANPNLKEGVIKTKS
ncbi:DUF4296 domain-containing protein [Winogradskyella haliclonae]|uniref:DUF4296 domain-containing protein n=1 Tax=Winogradskyella haliclonae TaxID=2048558 RepID=A0ABQ2BV14_9FLAO|nr:DUF4296 domain-containing protein [Winogradskyella haliclonae]GGI55899.1 hypothetical protein GCM10011444_02080 [Winogradskyella haliclonae]